MYINWFTWISPHDSICYTKIRGSKNSPNSLNVMVNYHYHEKKDNLPVIPIYALIHIIQITEVILAKEKIEIRLV